MLDKAQMQEIWDLKLCGYTKAEILAYYKEQGMKPPSRPTISKYYDMDIVPEDPGSKLSKDKVFDVSPFKETIIAVLEDNSRNDQHWGQTPFRRKEINNLLVPSLGAEAVTLGLNVDR